MHVLYRLLDLVVVVRSVNEGLHRDSQQHQQDYGQQDQQQHLLIDERGVGEGDGQTTEDYDGDPDYPQQDVSQSAVLLLQTAVVAVEESVDLLDRGHEVTIDQSLLVILPVAAGRLDEALAILVGLYDEPVLLEFHLYQGVIVVLLDAVLPEEQLDLLLLLQFLTHTNSTE